MGELQTAGAGVSTEKPVRYCPLCGLNWTGTFPFGAGIYCLPDDGGCGAKIKVIKARDE